MCTHPLLSYKINSLSRGTASFIGTFEHNQLWVRD